MGKSSSPPNDSSFSLPLNQLALVAFARSYSSLRLSRSFSTWGSWCGPCRAEQADINALVTQFAGRGVAFLGDDMRSDTRANALAFVTEFHVAYPSVFDPGSDIANAFDIIDPPFAVVVDASGSIRLREPASVADVPAALTTLLRGA